MSTSSPQPKPAIASLTSYRPSFGRPSFGRPSSVTKPAPAHPLIRLSANEGALGHSKKVTHALHASITDLHRYPDMQDQHLKDAIAEHHGLAADHIMLSNGSDELIALLTLAYLEAGDEVVMSEYAFLVIPQATKIVGGIPVFARDETTSKNNTKKDIRVSVDNLLAAITPKTKLLFLVNPNNPTGTMISVDEIKRLHSNMPKHILLVLDCAYAEYVGPAYEAAIARLVEAHDNIVMLRTFSKLHGLAGLRLGWAYAPPGIIQTLTSICPPFSVNRLAIHAGIAALRDTAFQAHVRIHTRKWIDAFMPFLDQLGIGVVPSSANFMLMYFDKSTGPSATQILDFFATRHILLRSMDAYHLPDHLRMSIGTDEEMALVKDMFIEAIKHARNMPEKEGLG